MMDLDSLLAVLADGEFHSGERLAARAGLTRAAVWKQMKRLADWGLRVEAGSGKGYRLSQPIELLDREQIRRDLEKDKRFECDTVDRFTEIDSTNRYLMAHPPSGSGKLRICVAEWQSAGRGRLERRWVSPLGAGICLSAAWTYAGTPSGFSGLSLAAGVAVANAIRACGGIATQLKWPNDIVWDSRKLGGVLVESRIESQGRCSIVIGVGLNVAVPAHVLKEVSDWRTGAVDLKTAVSGHAPTRNALVASIGGELGTLFRDFGQDAGDRWLAAWRDCDYLRGKEVRIMSGSESFSGTADGIDSDGALLVDVGSGQRRRVVAGDASVRTP